jgi:hypothetical protein
MKSLLVLVLKQWFNPLHIQLEYFILLHFYFYFYFYFTLKFYLTFKSYFAAGNTLHLHDSYSKSITKLAGMTLKSVQSKRTKSILQSSVTTVLHMSLLLIFQLIAVGLNSVLKDLLLLDIPTALSLKVNLLSDKIMLCKEYLVFISYLIMLLNCISTWFCACILV